MKTTLQFDPSDYTPATLQLILAKAEEWQTTPAATVSRLLDEAAASAGFHPEPDAAETVNA